MNSIAMEVDVLPTITSSWTLIIKPNDNNLQIDDLGFLFAKYKGTWYYIKCADSYLQLLTEYLLAEEQFLNISSKVIIDVV